MWGARIHSEYYWHLSMHSERLTLGMKMHSTAFLSMPNADGNGTTDRGFNSARGYPAWLPITTRQVTDVVMNDQDISPSREGVKCWNLSRT